MSQILVIGPQPRLFGPGNFRWLADTARALGRLGHRVTTVRYRESWTVSPRLTRWTRPVLGMPRTLERYRAAREQRRDRRLVQLARRLRPDLTILLNGEVFSAALVSQLKRAIPGRLVSWWEDDPVCHPSFMAAAPLFDHVCVFDRSYLPRLSAAGASSVHFLPCACDETVYRPLQLSQAEQRRYHSDLAFVGWYYPERAAVVRALAEVGLGVWGGQWDSPPAREALEHSSVVRGGGVDAATAARIHNACKIGLNIHATQSRLGGLNMRAFELLACGAFQLVDAIEGIEELLTPGEEVVCYRSPEEARQLARHYMADPGARQRIASRGRARVLDEHTFVHRLRTLCELARG